MRIAAEFGARQHGLATRSQLTLAGVARSTVDGWISSRQLIPVHAGVYRLAGVPPSWEQQVLAAVLATGGLASHRSAARLWGLLAGDTSVEVLVTHARSRLRGVVVHRSSLEYRASLRSGIPVTNPLDTLALLGAVASRDVVEEAAHQAIVKRLVTVEGLARALGRLAAPGRRGPAVLQSIVDEWELGRRAPDSILEIRMAKLLRERGLPRPVFQHEVWHEGRLVGRVDFAYPEAMIAIEVEGAERHTLPRDRQRDATRRNELTGLGWKVVVFTWFDVTRRPDYVAAQILDQLAA